MDNERIETLKNIRQLCYRYITQFDNRDESLNLFHLKPKTFLEAINAFIKIDDSISMLDGSNDDMYQKIINMIMEENKNEEKDMPF